MKALLIYKKSQYQIYVNERQNEHIKKLISDNNPIIKGMLLAHEEHERNLEVVHKILEKNFSSVRMRYRGAIDMVKTPEDIVITAGGDGTLLCAQKFIGPETPVLGVNTDTTRSVGALLATTVKDLEKYLEDLPNKTPVKINRLEVKVNDQVVRNRILNDVLFCHKNPAAMSVFEMIDRQLAASQLMVKSSGMWVSTAIGSTGAMSSAGGVKMHPFSPSYQMYIRELYSPLGLTVNQLFSSKQHFAIVSKMREGMLAFDGSRDVENVKMGDVVSFSCSPEPLTLYTGTKP